MIPFSLTDVDYPFNLYCSPDWSAETLQRLLHILGMRHWKTSISINNKGVLSNKKEFIDKLPNLEIYRRELGELLDANGKS